MAASREEPEGWRAEAETSSASGGHLSPDVRSTDHLVDALTTPLPSTTETDDAATEERRGEPREYGVQRKRRRVHPSVRRVKRTIRHVGAFSVLKMSLFFYVIFLFVWLVMVAIAYMFAESIGVFDAIEELRQGFALGGEEVRISLGTVEKYAFIVGLIVMVAATIINVILAFIYNVASDLIGGIELTFTERDR